MGVVLLGCSGWNYPDTADKGGWTSLSLSKPSKIRKEGGSCISKASVLSESGPIALKNCSNSLSTSFSPFIMCYDSRKFGCEFEIHRSLLAPILNRNDIRNSIKRGVYFYIIEYV
jgi:hypothetical protein